MKANKLVVELFSLAILSGSLVACTSGTTTNKQSNSQVQSVEAQYTNKSKTGIFEDDDYDTTFDEGTSVKINLEQLDNLSIEGVKFENNSLSISKAGTYILEGKLTEGQILVNVKDSEKVKLVLNGVDISSSTKTPIFVESADKVVITLVSNTQNNLSLTKEVENTENNKNSVIFSKGDLSFNGKGVLNLLSEYGKGIISEDKLVFIDGKYEINTLDHALRGTSSVAIADGEYDIKTGDEADAIKSEHESDKNLGYVYIDKGNFNISAGDDGITASSNVTISDGNINIIKSTEGIEGETIDINGGNIEVVSSDDAINASSSSSDDSTNNNQPSKADDSLYIRISGGKIKVDASGDGIDSNGNFYVTGGEIFVEGPLGTDNSALDYDGEGKITGGKIVALGSDGMAQSFSDSSTQGSILISFEKSKNDTFSLLDELGNTILEYKPTKEYKSVVVSTAELEKGKKYTLNSGDESISITLDKLTYSNTNNARGGNNFNRR